MNLSDEHLTKLLSAYDAIGSSVDGETVLDDLMRTYLFRENEVFEASIAEQYPDPAQRALIIQGAQLVVLSIREAFLDSKESLTHLRRNK